MAKTQGGTLSCKSVVGSGWRFDVARLGFEAAAVALTTQAATPPTVTTIAAAVRLCRALTADDTARLPTHAAALCGANATLCSATTIGGADGDAPVLAHVQSWASLAGLAPAAGPGVYSLAADQLKVAADGAAFSLLIPGDAWGGLSLATNISFVCVSDSGGASYASAGPAVNFNLSSNSLLHIDWPTPAACGVPLTSIGSGMLSCFFPLNTLNPIALGPGGMSLGGLFMLIVLLTIFFYFSIGSAYNILVNRITIFPHFIPNIAFWDQLVSRASNGRVNLAGGSGYIRV
ncbi:hypothetical protein HK100_008360 [Physocladia obscura]|uniref:Uncharacterized protein n=1 Tax=Physocladia obscura TaxID=109957 RepID=A0AAD5XBK1_9FUNG|nr:hypothetical protein HK100_008360 [Physocladia obscura]